MIINVKYMYVLSYKKRDEQVDLLSNVPDVAGSEMSGHADLGTV